MRKNYEILFIRKNYENIMKIKKKKKKKKTYIYIYKITIIKIK